MTNHATNAEIEDVLSSIRRLVSQDTRPEERDSEPVAADVAPRPAPTPVPDRGTLILTPQQRVPDTETTPPETSRKAAASVVPDTFEWAPRKERHIASPDPVAKVETSKDSEPNLSEPLTLDDTLRADDRPAKAETGKATEEPKSQTSAGSDMLRALVAEELARAVAEPDESDEPGDAPHQTTGADADHPEAEHPEPGADTTEATDEALAPEAAFFAGTDPAEAGGAFEDDPEAPATFSRPAKDPEPAAEAPEVRGEKPGAPDAAAPRARSLEDKIAELEAMIAQADAEWDVEDGRRGSPIPGPWPRAVAPTTPQPPAVADDVDLRALVADIVREELQGVLGERITRNVRKLVRREIQRALIGHEID
ncbi:hypothetical protein LVO79_10475 [Roseivivax marinus]|uniref:hypothetical protein n=1 Tax=Roseivivax marinus TaxID=1379903 RepID=UPI001F04B243|nr:hypothetical protein [Roseivivax marinus]UMA63481.1 hypothetical protein LVO79_10475 [Roseivivax marinus]